MSPCPPGPDRPWPRAKTSAAGPQTVRTGWDKLTGAQQWMCQQVLSIEPAKEAEKPKPSMSQTQEWAIHLTAAKQFFEREGHLKVPRKHVETITLPAPDADRGEERSLKLGTWIANQRLRAASLTPDRIEQLSKAGMRWA
ncbi:helicase associated domain-containing protein [Streptomyces sp. NPDC058463]|uniref:helicase associated domain-containing protein n=1 Tax=Streptomyces sp. NPDC058463 TaxID=3346510 RepID=UPI00364A910B